MIEVNSKNIEWVESETISGFGCTRGYLEEWGKCQFTCSYDNNSAGFVPVKEVIDIECPKCKAKDDLCGEVWLDKPKIYEILHPNSKYKYACIGCKHLWS